MTRVSSGKKKSGPPVHANRYAFVHNPNSRLTRQILAMPIGGVCPDCRAVLEWRKRFRKYKPLSVPKKCVRCGGKAIKEAYHIICRPCSAKDKVCAKCLQAWTPKLAADGTEILEPLPESTMVKGESDAEADATSELEGNSSAEDDATSELEGDNSEEYESADVDGVHAE